MKPPVIFGKNFSWSDVLFAVFIILLLIPQTRKPIQIGVNRLKLLVWSPSITNEAALEKIAPFSYTVANLAGQSVVHRIGENKPTLLGFWATWCGTCVAEMPSLEALYKDYGGQVNFVLVTQESPEVVQKFMRKKGYALPVYFQVSSLPDRLRSTALPTNYLIDAQGSLLIEETGAANWNSTRVRELLDKMVQ